jgi:DeoR/GlpR family transcriptional regulator of sugar metabolism
MLVEERRRRLLEKIRRRRFASMSELIDLLKVSESTVRRDLDYLESQGETRRIHGGVLYAGDSPGLDHFDDQGSGQSDLKKAIARAAVDLIDDGDSLLLDGGSTTYEVARLLVGRRLHVVTTSLPVANLFAADSASDLVFVGGNICSRSGVAQGPLADTMIGSLRVRKTMFSVAGVDEDGFFNNNLLLVETERAMMRSADEVIVVADSTKLGHKSLTHLCGLDEVQHMVIDNGIDDLWRERLTRAGVDLRVAEPEPTTVSRTQ